jgi:hypothetical protein
VAVREAMSTSIIVVRAVAMGDRRCSTRSHEQRRRYASDRGLAGLREATGG